MANHREENERMASLIVGTSPALLNYLIRRVENPEDAADLLADTYAVAWRRSARMPDESEQARMWLYGIAKNCLRNHRRTQRRRSALVEALRTELRYVKRPDEMDLRGLELREATSRLSAPHRELVLLVYGDGFSIEDAARLCGLPASTARSRIVTAKGQLKRMLTDAADDRIRQV